MYSEIAQRSSETEMMAKENTVAQLTFIGNNLGELTIYIPFKTITKHAVTNSSNYCVPDTCTKTVTYTQGHYFV